MRCGARQTGRGRATCSTAQDSCAALERKGAALRGRRVALFGAGGAGSAIALRARGGGCRRRLPIVDPQSRARGGACGDAARARFPRVRCRGGTVMPAGRRHGRQRVAGRDATPATGCRATSARSSAGTLVGDVVVSGSPTPLDSARACVTVARMSPAATCIGGRSMPSWISSRRVRNDRRTRTS